MQSTGGIVQEGALSLYFMFLKLLYGKYNRSNVSSPVPLDLQFLIFDQHKLHYISEKY